MGWKLWMGMPNELTEFELEFRPVNPKICATWPVLPPPMFPEYAPSTPRSRPVLRITCRKTTLMSTCGLGLSRFVNTLRTLSRVTSSLMTTTRRDSGSIEK